MNRPEPIELENNLGPDAVTGEINRVPWMAYDVDEMDLYIAEKDAEIAELKAALERDFVAKKSAETVLRYLLDCGLIKEWFYNGTFHAVLKADDPHLQIAELKQKLMPCLNGDCILTCEVVEKYGKENAELKQKLSEKDAEIESLKASHYAEMVDAGMRERRLRRALFIALAYKAKYKKYWYCELLEQEGSKILSDNKKAKKYNAVIKMCQKCEAKCRAKAEEYK